MLILGLRSKLVKPNTDFETLLCQTLKTNKIQLKNGDILVITSKIVSVCEGRIVRFRGRNGFLKLVKQEADRFFGGKVPLTLKDGVLIPQAGIDVSNAKEGTAILWPKDSWKTAENVRREICRELGLKKFGVIISDSHCQPLRWGTTGIALAWSGFEGVEDFRGKKDLFGKKLKVTKKGTADQLASAAAMLMGEAAERVPMVVIRGAPAKFTAKKQTTKEVLIAPKDCLFAPVYRW